MEQTKGYGLYFPLSGRQGGKYRAPRFEAFQGRFWKGGLRMARIWEKEDPFGYWVTDDGLTLLTAWKRDGLTDANIAKNMGISPSVLRDWKKECREIKEALMVGKELLDYRVENALLKAALGYTTKEVKVTLGKKIVGGEAFQVLKETTTKEVGPNAVACLAWLNNRKHDQWKRNRDNVVDLDKEDSNVTVTIIRGGRKDQDGVNEGVSVTMNGRNGPKHLTDEEAKQGGLDSWPDDWSEDDE